LWLGVKPTRKIQRSYKKLFPAHGKRLGAHLVIYFLVVAVHVCGTRAMGLIGDFFPFYYVQMPPYLYDAITDGLSNFEKFSLYLDQLQCLDFDPKFGHCHYEGIG